MYSRAVSLLLALFIGSASAGPDYLQRPEAGGSASYGPVEWGDIEGTVSNQTDLGDAATLDVGTTAGTVAAGNDARLSDARTPTSHTHGNLSNAGAIGSTAALPIITTTAGVLTAGSFGTTAGTFAAGDDSRLSNARTPTAHAASHASGQSDAIKLDDLAAPDDNTDLDATTGHHGLLPKLGGGTTNFLRADGTWAAAGGGSPGGANTQVQFNDSSAFGGDSGLTYNKSTKALTAGGKVTGHSGSATVPGVALDDSSGMGLSYYTGIGGMGFTDQGYTRAWVSGTNGQFGVYSGGSYNFGASAAANNFDVSIFRDAAGILAVRCADTPTTGQVIRVYNTITNLSNYERAVLDWKATSNTLKIGAEAAGSGTLRPVSFVGASFAFDADAIRIVTNRTPANAAAACTAGELFSDDNYIYKCVASGNIKRSAIATW
jgi:hypothetical protein